jgi:hypothetical protein
MRVIRLAATTKTILIFAWHLVEASTYSKIALFIALIIMLIITLIDYNGTTDN